MSTALLFVLLTAAPPAEFSITLSEGVLAGLLTAAAPIEQVVEQDVGVAGRMQLVVTFTEPQVRITNAAIKISMNYHAKNNSGFIDVRGVAKPDMVIVANAAKGVFEARFTRVILTLPGGIEVPVEGALKPIEIPGVITEEVNLGAKVISAQGRGSSVQLETGKVHLRGTMEFSAKAAPRRAGP
jgi:hypothetical protein